MVVTAPPCRAVPLCCWASRCRSSHAACSAALESRTSCASNSRAWMVLPSAAWSRAWAWPRAASVLGIAVGQAFWSFARTESIPGSACLIWCSAPDEVLAAYSWTAAAIAASPGCRLIGRSRRRDRSSSDLGSELELVGRTGLQIQPRRVEGGLDRGARELGLREGAGVVVRAEQRVVDVQVRVSQSEAGMSSPDQVDADQFLVRPDSGTVAMPR